jgi:NTE family protein
VISAVSSGSVIAAMYAYSDESFANFETRVIELLRHGLIGSIAKLALFSREAVGSIFTSVTAGLAALGASVVRTTVASTRLFATENRSEPHWRSGIQPPLRRWNSRTTAFAAALRALLFDDKSLNARRRNNMDVIFNACELRTGTAFRFGSKESGCWRFGKLRDNQISLALAVAASAAYPTLLPAIDERFTFVDRNGDERSSRVILTDGGAYDNLGLSSLEPGRSPDFSTNVFSLNYLICCDAGTGQFGDNVHPYFWPSRMRRAFETTFRRTLAESYGRLH